MPAEPGRTPAGLTACVTIAAIAANTTLAPTKGSEVDDDDFLML